MQQIEQNLPPVAVKDPLPLKDIAKLLVKHYGLHEGLYDLTLEFTIGLGPIGPSPEAIVPGAMVGINRVGLIKVPEAKTPSTVDAAEVNPKRKPRKKQ